MAKIKGTNKKDILRGHPMPTSSSASPATTP